MSLFGNRQEANLKACEQMVESVLEERGINPEKSRIQSGAGPAWGMTQGSAEVYIFLTSAEDGENFIQVVSPVMKPTVETMAGTVFMKKLLELNANELTGAAFGLRDDEVVLTCDRSTSGLDRVEVEDMIRRVSEYADRFDDELVQTYGGKRHCDL
jgi:hypothetical protein